MMRNLLNLTALLLLSLSITSLSFKHHFPFDTVISPLVWNLVFFGIKKLHPNKGMEFQKNGDDLLSHNNVQYHRRWRS